MTLPVTQVLLHFEEGNGSTAVVDTAGVVAWTCISSSESTAQHKFGSGSLDLTNSAGSLRAPSAVGGSFDLGSVAGATPNEWTMEFWFYPRSLPATTFRTICDFTSGLQSGFALRLLPSGHVGFIGCGSWINANAQIDTGQSPTLNAWNHMLIQGHNVAGSNSIRFFLNGVASGGLNNNYATIPVLSTPSTVYLGNSPNYPTGEGSDFYIDEFRLVTNYAIYFAQTTFTPTTFGLQLVPVATTSAPVLSLGTVASTQVPLTWTQPSAGPPGLLLHMDDAGLSDSSNSAFATTISGASQSAVQTKFGASSAFFPGTHTSVSVPFTSGGPIDLTGPAFDNFDYDFTVDYWVFPTQLNASNGVETHIDLSNGFSSLFRINMQNAGVMVAQTFGTVFSSPITAGAHVLVVNQWNHVALVRFGNRLRLYVNGALDSGSTVSITSSFGPALTGAQPAYVGASYNSGVQSTGLFQGYIDELRITKGLALWIDTTFTPPTSPGSPSGAGATPFQYVIQRDGTNVGVEPTSSGLAFTDVSMPGPGTYHYLVYGTDASLVTVTPLSNIVTAVTGLPTVSVYGKFAQAGQAFKPVCLSNIKGIQPRIYMPGEDNTIRITDRQP